MNDSDWISLQYFEVTVHNHWMPQFDRFQTQTIAYLLLAKDESQIRISNHENEKNSMKFRIFWYV